MESVGFMAKTSLLKHFETGHQMTDMVIGMLLCTFIASIVSLFNLKTIWNKCRSVYNRCRCKKKVNSSIQYKIQKNNPHEAFKAILYKINKMDNDNINKLKLYTYCEWLWGKGYYSNDSIYTINEGLSVEIHDDIWIYFTESHEKSGEGENANIIEYFNITLSSNDHNVRYIKDYIAKCKKEYEEYKKGRSTKNNYFIEVDYDKTKNILVHNQFLYNTTKTLDNVFFTQKKELMDKLNFFLNNKEWYERTGKPYTFGIMLHGAPGCGKTSFIKALLNTTKRCGIKINLNDDLDLKKLHNLILTDNVGELYIPSNRRILIFEEIDCMGDLVKDRELKKKEYEQVREIMESGTSGPTVEMRDVVRRTLQDSDNNLGTLLNILDGPIETTGTLSIYTTNHPEVLDKALLRPGRVDCMIHFTKCTQDMLVDVVNHFYDTKEVKHKHVKKYVPETISPAMVDNVCFKHKDVKKAIKELVKMSKKIDKEEKAKEKERLKEKKEKERLNRLKAVVQLKKLKKFEKEHGIEDSDDEAEEDKKSKNSDNEREDVEKTDDESEDGGDESDDSDGSAGMELISDAFRSMAAEENRNREKKERQLLGVETSPKDDKPETLDDNVDGFVINDDETSDGDDTDEDEQGTDPSANEDRPSSISILDILANSDQQDL